MVDHSLFTTVADNTLLPFGGTLIAQGDDNVEGPFDITAIFESGFTFGSQTFTEMFIGTNGGVTFNADNPQVPFSNIFNSSDFSIAPFNDDLDTRTLPPGPNPGVYFDTNTDRDSIVVTWNTVGQFENNIATPNSFQLEIMDLGDGDAELIFRFFDMQVSNGSFHMGARTDDGLPVYLSGGTATDQLGTAADLETLVGNTGVAGVWQMRVIDGQLQPTDFTGDIKTGNTGNNTLNGTPLYDVLSGGAGNDTIFGLAGIDTLNGNEDNDSISGGDDSDLIHGDDGNDTLRGDAGNDTIFGDAGDDMLFGGRGTNELEGGAGTDALDGSGGISVASYANASAGLRVDLSNTSSNTGDAAGDTYTNLFDLRGSAFADELVGNDSANNLFGGSGNDSLTGNAGIDLLEGQEGDDLLNGGADNDTLDGGLGADTLRGGAGNDSLTGGSGADHFMVETGMGNDVVTDFALGEDSIDFSLLSSAERDAVTFSTNGSGHRVVTLGDGSTMTLTGVAGNSEPTGAVTISGTPQVGETLTANSDGVSDADGIDTSTETGQWLRDGTPIAGATGETYTLVAADIGTQISVRYSYTDNFGTNESVTSAATVPVTSGSLTLVGTPAPDTLEGGEGDDDLSGLGDNDVLRGFGGNDTLRGGDGADTLNGGDGDDLILGGDTASDLRDVIFAGEGNDSVDAGSGNDLIFGMGGNDTIAGGFGVDEIQGQDGDDVITGSAFSDLVFGGAGNDFVNGGFGHDRINGGTGADKFYHLGIFDHGSDWVQDYNAAEGDVLLFGNAAAARADFQVNFAHTASAEGERAGDDAVQEAFVIYRPTGQIMWALVDGQGQSSINLQIGADVFDLLA